MLPPPPRPFERPRLPKARPAFLLPAQAEAAVAGAAPHLGPLLVFLACVGARTGEALRLDWTDVDLAAGTATFWEDETKAGRRRVARLSPRAVAALAALPLRTGRVFRRDDGEPYKITEGKGGVVKTAWATAAGRAGLPGRWSERPNRSGMPGGPPRRVFHPEHSPHDLRHTWASWHYALHKDLLLLKEEGGWSSVAMVERYAHLMPSGQEAAIREFWGLPPEPAARVGTKLTQPARRRA